jgi:hypothetical protein
MGIGLTLAKILAPGVDAVVKNWRPFVVIQVANLLMVIAYYTVPLAQRACAVLGRWKAEGGVLFAALAVAGAAVILPEIARRITKVPRDKPLTVADMCFQGGYFAVLGIAIDAFYRLLGHIIGLNPTPQVVVMKVATDMIGFSGFLSMPLAVILFAWRDADFNFREAGRLLAGGGFWERYVPLIVTCWAFWLPVMACLYCLPVNLQFVFAVLTEAAWCLLLVTAASRVPEVDKTMA